MLFKNAFHDLFATQRSGSIPCLDVVRSLAIFLVVGGHSIELGFAGLPAKIFYWGWTGVDLFFVLSGFLIGRQLWSELDRTQTIHVQRFLIKRGFRIWPLYLAATFAYLLWDLATHQSLQPLWADLLYVSNYFHSRVKGGWSLSTEEQFYVLMPILLLALKRLPIRYLFVFPLGWLLLLPALRALQIAYQPNQPALETIYIPFHTHTDGLAVGVLLAWIAVVFKDWWNGNSGRLWLPLSIAATGLGLRFAAQGIFSYTALALFYGALILLAVRAPGYSPFATWRGFHVVSRLSYGVYLSHLAILEGAAPLIRPHLAGASTNPVVFAAVLVALGAVSLATAFVTYSLIERPFLIWRDRWLEPACHPSFLPSPQQQHLGSLPVAV